MNKLFLLDAYALIYRAYYAFIRAPRINSKGQNTSAVFGFVNSLEDVLSKAAPTHIGVAFDPSGPTFRHDVFPDYKAQREATPEDIKTAVPFIKRIIEAYNIPILEVPGYEADDVIGTLACQASAQGIETYMMTPDKDYAQLVTEHVKMYRPGKAGGEAEVLGVAEVKEKYGLESPLQVIDLLGLMGDAADNIPGCPGVGEKTAIKLIQQFGSIENLLDNTHQLKGAQKQKVEDNKEQIAFSKFLATIKTDVPLTLDLESLERKEPDREALIRIYEELEFRTFINKLTKTEAAPVSAQKETFAGSLFAEFEDNGSETHKSENLQTLSDVTVSYKLIETEAERKKLCDYLLTSSTLCLDTETTDTDATRAELVGLSFSVKPFEAFYVPVPADEEKARSVVSEFAAVLENEASVKIGQNIKYDLMMLERYGVRLGGKLFDTMLAHYVLQPELRHNMDYMAEICLGYRTIHIDELIGPKGKQQKSMASLTPQEVYTYACEDADVTLRLKEYLDPLLDNQPDARQLFEEIEMPLVRVLASMELAGVHIDTAALKDTEKVFKTRLTDIETQIYEAAGAPFNISSPRQVGEVLFEKLRITEKAKKTKSGQYVTSEEVLETYREAHPIVGKILAYRGLKKLLSTYVEALPKLIHPQTGNIHTSFNQAVTATGRLSSSDPNLQNIPVRGDDGKEIRKAFVPYPGQLFFSADYSQIELRLMAHLSEDPHMIKAFKEGQDIHADTAARIFHHLRIEDVTSDERRKAKTANFGIIYGISAFGLASRLNISRTEAKSLIDSYFANYPTVQKYMDESIAQARRQGFAATLFGRRRYLTDINSGNSVVRGYAERNAINTPIQGTAADIIKVAMIRIHERFSRENIRSKMILQVHDELNFSVLSEEREQVQRIVIEEMERAYTLRVPLSADCGWGDNWLEAH